MPYDKKFWDHTTDEQEGIASVMAGRWKKAGKLLRQRKTARTQEERAAINAELSGLRDLIVPDTNTLLPAP